MVHCCTVCMNNAKRNVNISFFTYPRDRERRNKWLKAVWREDLIPKLDDERKRPNYRICEAHFETNCVVLSVTGNVKNLSVYAFPTLNLHSVTSAGASQCHPGSGHQLQDDQNTSAPNIPKCSDTPKNEVLCPSERQHQHSKQRTDQAASPAGAGKKHKTDAVLSFKGRYLNEKKQTGQVEPSFYCIGCTTCQSVISGFRYTCVQCPGVQLCAACEVLGLHPLHYMLRAPASRPPVSTFHSPVPSLVLHLSVSSVFLCPQST